MLRYTLFAAACLLFVAGCGSKGGNVVTGKVSFQGQPVTGGNVTLVPETGGGKPAAADVQSDGTFTMKPGSETGGAVAGRHRVLYSAPVMELPAGTELQPGQRPPMSPFDGLRPTTEIVEIKGGQNSLAIELTK
jgi:hypothetical protein